MSALAGRRLADPDAKLSIMAVGDDDQNIYSFRHASVEFIRRFQADYDGATTTYLVENFRSTQNIIAAANQVIQRAADRMKVTIRSGSTLDVLRSRPEVDGRRWMPTNTEGTAS
ncbi:MAG: UvrD-helicase domain-containing protein [Betaproteobacteria bacterium]|nr:UvrD-helicase domain-containing protein [Betaproteobacteria bacterium]